MSRVFTVVRKDMVWAKNNQKLLWLMLLPVIVTVFFSQFDSAATFTFSLIFVNAFVGIFSTSYSIIEEKNRGTLLALLTTPLTSLELLLGKFLYNLILCGLFSVLVILFNKRFDLLAQPLALLNIILFAGTTCFIGFILGVFFKNEQAMSVLSPFLMLLFCAGDSLQKTALNYKIQVFLPDYQLVKILKDVPIGYSTFLEASFYSLALFVISLAMAGTYTKFYFSNSRETLFSKQLIGFVFLFMGVLVFSGVNANRGGSRPIDESKLQRVEFKTQRLKASFSYDPKLWSHKNLLESREKTIERLQLKKEKETQIVAAFRDLEPNESNIEMRREKVKKDHRRVVLSHQTLDTEIGAVDQWIYGIQSRFVIIREQLCGSQILQLSLDIETKKKQNLNSLLEQYLLIFDSLKFKCPLT